MMNDDNEMHDDNEIHLYVRQLESSIFKRLLDLKRIFIFFFRWIRKRKKIKKEKRLSARI